MEILYDQNDYKIKKYLEDNDNESDPSVKVFCKEDDLIQITFKVSDSLIANTIINILFNQSTNEKSPLGLDLISIATENNCITEDTKKEILGHLDKCKELIMGDQPRELSQLGNLFGGLGGLIGNFGNVMPHDFMPDLDSQKEGEGDIDE